MFQFLSIHHVCGDGFVVKGVIRSMTCCQPLSPSLASLEVKRFQFASRPSADSQRQIRGQWALGMVCVCKHQSKVPQSKCKASYKGILGIRDSDII